MAEGARSTGLRRWLRRDDRVTAWVFLLPNLIGFLVFMLFPMLAAFVLAFMEWDFLQDPEWTGTSNFERAVKDPLVVKYLFNTVFLMLGIPLNIALSLLLAILLSEPRLRGTVFFRTLFFLPSIVSGVATFVVWLTILNPDFGLLNRSLGVLGIDGPNWLAAIMWEGPSGVIVDWAKPALMLMGLWAGIGGVSMLLYLAALKGIPRELYEAADLDGASWWRRAWHITWPMVSPTTFFILIVSVIGGLQGGFEMAYIMTEGGPAGGTKTIGYYIYEVAFEDTEYGYAAAVSCLLFVMIFALTLVQWRVGTKKVHYG